MPRALGSRPVFGADCHGPEPIRTGTPPQRATDDPELRARLTEVPERLMRIPAFYKSDSAQGPVAPNGSRFSFARLALSQPGHEGDVLTNRKGPAWDFFRSGADLRRVRRAPDAARGLGRSAFPWRLLALAAAITAAEDRSLAIRQ